MAVVNYAVRMLVPRPLCRPNIACRTGRSVVHKPDKSCFARKPKKTYF